MFPRELILCKGWAQKMSFKKMKYVLFGILMAMPLIGVAAEISELNQKKNEFAQEVIHQERLYQEVLALSDPGIQKFAIQKMLNVQWTNFYREHSVNPVLPAVSSESHFVLQQDQQFDACGNLQKIPPTFKETKRDQWLRDGFGTRPCPSCRFWRSPFEK